MCYVWDTYFQCLWKQIRWVFFSNIIQGIRNIKCFRKLFAQNLRDNPIDHMVWQLTPFWQRKAARWQNQVIFNISAGKKSKQFAKNFMWLQKEVIKTKIICNAVIFSCVSRSDSNQIITLVAIKYLHKDKNWICL